VTEVTDKVERAIARFERVTSNLDARGGPVREAAKRERQRLNADLTRRFARVGTAVLVISILTIAIGLFIPIGMFGFLAAVGLAVGVAALLAFAPSAERTVAAPSSDLPNGEMVQRFDSYLYRTRRALPAPAQAEVDAISAILPALKQTLERHETLDPDAQDARRLMSIHLPGLVDRYMRVPAAFRTERDGEDKTVDERLVEGLSAGRTALADISERLARADVAALETQGRFIRSRYGSEGPQSSVPEKDGNGATVDS
jgi:hypothetical protein